MALTGLELDQGPSHTRRSWPQWVRGQGGPLIRRQSPRLSGRGWRNILLEDAGEEVIQCDLNWHHQLVLLFSSVLHNTHVYKTHYSPCRLLLNEYMHQSM